MTTLTGSHGALKVLGANGPHRRTGHRSTSTPTIVRSERWGVGVVESWCHRRERAMRGAESGGGDESPPEPLLNRMWAEASTALAEEPYRTALSSVCRAVHAGDIATARDEIGTAYRVILSDYVKEQRRAHLGYLRSRGVEQIHHEAVYHDACKSAFGAIELFERGEKDYAGEDPKSATPIRTTVQKWFSSHLDGTVRDHRDRMQKARIWLVSAEGGIGDGGPAQLPGPDDTEDEALGNLQIEELEALHQGRLVFLQRCRIATSRLDLESPDLKVRRAGSDEQRVRRLLVPIVLGFLTRLEELVASSEVSDRSAIEMLFEAFRDACRVDEPDGPPNNRHKFFERNRPEAIWAARAVLDFNVTSSDDPAGSPEARARFDAQEVLIAFGSGVIQPLAERLALHITTNEVGYKSNPQVGHTRFVASYRWLEEVLGWVVDETSPAKVLKVVTPALKTLRDPISATRNVTPAEVARAIEASDNLEMSADARVFLALVDRLAGLEASLRTKVEVRRS